MIAYLESLRHADKRHCLLHRLGLCFKGLLLLSCRFITLLSLCNLLNHSDLRQQSINNNSPLKFRVPIRVQFHIYCVNQSESYLHILVAHKVHETESVESKDVASIEHDLFCPTKDKLIRSKSYVNQ